MIFIGTNIVIDVFLELFWCMRARKYTRPLKEIINIRIEMRLRCDPFVRFCLFFDLFFMRLLSFEHNLCVFNSKIISTASMRCEYRTALVHRLLTWCLVYNNAVNFQIRRFFVVVFYSPFEHRMDFEFFSVRFSSLEVFFLLNLRECVSFCEHKILFIVFISLWSICSLLHIRLMCVHSAGIAGCCRCALCNMIGWY